LCFNHPYVSAELFGGFHGFLNAEAGYSLGRCNVKPPQDVFSLVFVDFHGWGEALTMKYMVIILTASREERQVHF